MIVPVTADHFREIARIDAEGFGRTEPRSSRNLLALTATSGGVSGVYLHQGEVSGYAFAKVMGNTGYIGPVGVREQMQGRGIGRALMLAMIEQLKPYCAVIGLEVRPGNSRAIGLYSHLGFVNTFPSVNFLLPRIDALHEMPESETDETAAISDIVACGDLESIDQIARFTRPEAASDMSVDLRWAVENRSGSVLVLSDGSGQPRAFLAYVPDLIDLVWGAADRESGSAALAGLMCELRSMLPDHRLIARVNSRYVDLCTKLGSRLEVDSTTNRMLLRGYTGDEMATSDAMMIRAWIG